jgi:hypothetical protein
MTVGDNAARARSSALLLQPFQWERAREEVPKGLRSGNMYIFARCRELGWRAFLLVGGKKISPRAACLYVCAKLCDTLILRWDKNNAPNLLTIGVETFD